MNYDSYITIEEPLTEVEFSQPELKKPGRNPDISTRVVARPDRYIALVDSRTFMRECLQRSMQAELSLPVETFSTLSELENQFSESVALVILCLPDAGKAECANALTVFSSLSPSVPIVVLAPVNDPELARTAHSLGAKGYIPSATNFEVAIAAVRFILAGGTYIPIDCLLAAVPPAPSSTQASDSSIVLTDREIGVVKAIQQGKSNKIIAYQLCICEGTVKVHVRNIMKKMKAKNRTEIAIKAQTALAMDIERPRPGS